MNSTNHCERPEDRSGSAGRIEEAFRNCKERDESALIVYLTGGYPSFETSLNYLLACTEGGADIIEIGVPFSDPMADGAVIQKASDEALRAGVTPKRVLELTAKIREKCDVPIVLMGYYNPIFRMGEEEFVKQAKKAGVDGLIVADLPIEESLTLELFCINEGIHLIQLIAPTTPEDRMMHIAGRSSGYLYLVSRLGTTGARGKLNDGLPALMARAKEAAGDLPLAVGFGISTKQHAEDITALGADGIIVGSAIISRIIDGAKPHEVRDFVRELKSGCRKR
jgi:tryptophan synthase alpha subunit